VFCKFEQWRRCSSQISSLVAHTVLFGEGMDAFEYDIEDNTIAELEQAYCRKK